MNEKSDDDDMEERKRRQRQDQLFQKLIKGQDEDRKPVSSMNLDNSQVLYFMLANNYSRAQELLTFLFIYLREPTSHIILPTGNVVLEIIGY